MYFSEDNGEDAMDDLIMCCLNYGERFEKPAMDGEPAQIIIFSEVPATTAFQLSSGL